MAYLRICRFTYARSYLVCVIQKKNQPHAMLIAESKICKCRRAQQTKIVFDVRHQFPYGVGLK